MKNCGYIAIIGRPNVGKSTLLNYILKYKVSITSRKPQTTHHRIIGIKTTQDTQYIYIDTPGLYKDSSRVINCIINKQSFNAIIEADVILFVIEVGKWISDEDWILQQIKTFNLPVILVVNKVDQLKNRTKASDFMNEIKKKYSFSSEFLVSAKQGHLINLLESKVKYYLPTSDNFFYDKDQKIIRDTKFVVADIIREKLIRNFGKEIPYQLNVEITCNESNKEQKTRKIHAVIFTERPSQKSIVIGQEGKKIKKIGSEARKDLESFLGEKIFLRLWVTVKVGWSMNKSILKSLGYIV